MAIKQINGFLNYMISDTGFVLSIISDKDHPDGRILKPGTKSAGYKYVNLWGDDNQMHPWTIHRLVALHFIPNPDNKPCVNHINGNKSDNRVENLEWVTHKENHVHARSIGLFPVGEARPESRLKEPEIITIRQMYSDGYTMVSIAQKYLVAPTTVRNIIHRITWKHI